MANRQYYLFIIINNAAGVRDKQARPNCVMETLWCILLKMRSAFVFQIDVADRDIFGATPMDNNYFNR